MKPYETIYLQWGNHADWDSITWCADEIDDDDVEYIRKDIYDELKAENEVARVVQFRAELAVKNDAIYRLEADAEMVSRYNGQYAQTDMRKMKLTFGSLFSGIGGIDLGFERAGMSCSWQVEIDDYCNRVLEKQWPDVRRYRDVKEVGKHNLEPVDVITGGFPCQPHSVAGKRKGADDDRNLWPEYLRIIKELQPTYVVGENVPGIITTYLDTVLSDLESAGYEVATFNLPAVAFDAPHRRERIFVVAHSESQQSGRGKFRGLATYAGTKGKDVAYSTSMERPAGAKEQGEIRTQPENEREHDNACGSSETRTEDMANTTPIHAQRFDNGQGQGELGGNCRWPVEPRVGRVAHGVPHRVDRLKGLGNAVVPQVAEFIGRHIIAANTLYQHD